MGPNILSLVLNTDSARWTVEAFINGVALTANGVPVIYPYANGDNPVINSIYFADGGGSLTATYSNLTLTNTPNVPEPSTWALLGAGIVSLGLFFRFRRRNS